jgi:hypothetical protein
MRGDAYDFVTIGEAVGSADGHIVIIESSRNESTSLCNWEIAPLRRVHPQRGGGNRRCVPAFRAADPSRAAGRLHQIEPPRRTTTNACTRALNPGHKSPGILMRLRCARQRRRAAR